MCIRDSAGAEDLHPAGAGADGTAAATAVGAGHVDLARRLGEGEVARPEAHADLRREEPPEEGLERPLEVAESDPLRHRQPLDLVEHRRVPQIVVVAVDTPRADDPDRRLARQHRADLHRRGVGAQQATVGAVSYTHLDVYKRQAPR